MTPPAKTPMGEALRRHGSDKAWPHCFDLVYSELFPDRFAPLDVLEIGIADGQSLRAWKEYFPNARIVGVDVEPCARLAEDRIEVHQIEQTDMVALWRMIGERRFDWIIEDAQHVLDKQVETLFWMYPALKPGGVYCVEDLSLLTFGGFDTVDALGAFRGTYHNLNTAEYTDGGQLFVVRRPA